MRYPGVVDEPVQGAVLLPQRLGQVRPLLGARDVEPPVRDPVDGIDGITHVNGDHGRALGLQRARFGRALPLARTRDDDDLSGSPARHRYPFLTTLPASIGSATPVT